MKAPALLGITLVVFGCHAASDEHRAVVLMQPHEGVRLWSFHESKDELGSGGELQIFIDAETHPQAWAGFAKYTLGVGGALPVHRHDKTEEFAYILSGEGVAVVLDNGGMEVEVPVSAGYVWYNPPGAWHAIRNTGSAPLSLVFTVVPNEKQGLLSFFRRISVKPGQEPIALSPQELERVASEHDLILRAPDANENQEVRRALTVPPP